MGINEGRGGDRNLWPRPIRKPSNNNGCK